MPDKIQISEEAELSCKAGEITEEELNWLEDSEVLNLKSRNEEEISWLEVDVSKLSQIAFEYKLLRSTASSVEIDVLGAFKRAGDDILTTQQVTNMTSRPKSSVSRALSRLVEKNKLQKVQDGVYKY